ncbi:MAG: dUTP diphosphatase [Desulfovibrio sp.]|nr:dUTP diphosphatase [Desulfovibrio sp.]
MQIRFTRLCPEAHAPFRGSSDAAGYDLVAVSKTWDAERQCWIFGTGLAVEIPLGYVGLLFPRSSVFKTRHFLANAVGVIDADYRGEIKAIFRSVGDTANEYAIGERIVQLLILPVASVEYVEVSELSQTTRGSGGLGSTGSCVKEPFVQQC